MSEDHPLGQIKHVPSGFEGRLQRTYDHDRAAVWSKLTQPSEIAKWLAPGTIELHLGGKVRIDFADSGIVIDSSVLAYEAERVLAYSWSSGNEPERPMRWELADAGAGTQVTLTVHIPAGEDAAKACAGFEGHLEMLAAALEDVPVKFPLQLYLDARKGYQEILTHAQ
jgi:uncharacterized protein YndB with AHSA1/START domain